MANCCTVTCITALSTGGSIFPFSPHPPLGGVYLLALLFLHGTDAGLIFQHKFQLLNKISKLIFKFNSRIKIRAQNSCLVLFVMSYSNNKNVKFKVSLISNSISILTDNVLWLVFLYTTSDIYFTPLA